jgi:hypothetical protein
VVSYCRNIPKFSRRAWGKTQKKNLLRDMIVSRSKFEPGTPEYKQGTSEIQSNLSMCNFSTQLNNYGTRGSINTII